MRRSKILAESLITIDSNRQDNTAIFPTKELANKHDNQPELLSNRLFLYRKFVL